MKERTNHAPFTSCGPQAPTPHACPGSQFDHGTFELVLCPCTCHTPAAVETHDRGEEESDRYIRITCSCGHRGPWRFAAGPAVNRLLNSDDGQHIFTVRRAQA